MKTMRSILKFTLLFAFTAASVFTLTGCGSSTEGPKVDLHPVSGVVKLNGSALSNAAVTFYPDGAGGAEHTYYGATDAEGKFVLKSRAGKEGCEAGKFKAVISKRTMSDGSPMPTDDSPEAAAMAADSIESLPTKYSDADATELRYEVPAGGKEFQIDLNE